jgi:hypothetical protein
MLETPTNVSPPDLIKISTHEVNLSLRLRNQAPRHENVWGCGGIAAPFLSSTLDRGEWSVSCPGRFPPGERAPGTHWIGGWMGPRAGVDALNLTPAVLSAIRCYIN